MQSTLTKTTMMSGTFECLHGSHILTSRSCPYIAKNCRQRLERDLCSGIYDLAPVDGQWQPYVVQKRVLLHFVPVLLEIGDVVRITPVKGPPWYRKYYLATEAPSEAKYTLTAGARLVCMELWTEKYLSAETGETGRSEHRGV